jgi:hypothetical protein
LIENEMQNSVNVNEMLNEPLTMAELIRAVTKLKRNKAVGFDKIPNEVLKQNNIRLLLYGLFSTCFNYSMVPTIWLKGIISPIPKGADTYPFVPLNYRGVSRFCRVFIKRTQVSSAATVWSDTWKILTFLSMHKMASALNVRVLIMLSHCLL